MNFARSGFAEQPYYLTARRSAYNRVVNKYNPLVPYHIVDSRELYFYLVESAVVSYERAAYVFVLDKTDSIRNPRLDAVSERGVKSGVGHSDYDVRVGWMRPCKDLSGFDS